MLEVYQVKGRRSNSTRISNQNLVNVADIRVLDMLFWKFPIYLPIRVLYNNSDNLSLLPSPFVAGKCTYESMKAV